jgi:hypothetical protein
VHRLRDRWRRRGGLGQKLVDLGAGADDEVGAALHTSGVVNYGRPFSNNKSGKNGVRTTFGKKVIRGHPNYDESIHQQLLDLRNKLIAHSDGDYSDGRLFRKLLSLNIGLDRIELLIGASVLTQTVHLLHDTTLRQRCLTHVKAAEEAAYAAAIKRLEEFVEAGREFPDAINAACAVSDRKPPINVGNFHLSSDKPAAHMPFTTLNPHAVLNFPPLVVGPDGYAYRGLSLQIDLAGMLTWQKDDGSEGQIEIKRSEDRAPLQLAEKARDG